MIGTSMVATTFDFIQIDDFPTLLLSGIHAKYLGLWNIIKALCSMITYRTRETNRRYDT